jgi:type IV pilus assembly protein PilZ
LKHNNCILDVRISDCTSLSKCWIPFLRNGGIFIPTQRDLPLGSYVFVLLKLFEENRVWPLYCQVAMINEPGLDGGRLPGIGLQFLSVDQDLLDRIKSVLANAGRDFNLAW